MHPIGSKDREQSNLEFSIITHWTRSVVNYDISYQMVMIHQDIVLHELSTLRGYWVCAEFNKGLWHIGETPRLSYMFYRLGHYWWKLIATVILDKDTMIFYVIQTSCPLRWFKGHVIKILKWNLTYSLVS